MTTASGGTDDALVPRATWLVRGPHQRTTSPPTATVAAGASDSARVTRSSEIKIAVEIRGRVLSFYIGDELVGTHTAADAIAGSLSLGVGSRSSAVFKRLRVEQIEEVATPQ